MICKVPGPKSLAQNNLLDQVTEARHSHFIVDYENSKGSYIQDIDGNLMLDTYMNIASIALGYNHPEMMEFAASKVVGSMLANRPALGFHPPINYDKMVQKGVINQAPKGFDYVNNMMCGSCSVEAAYKACMMAYKKK